MFNYSLLDVNESFSNENNLIYTANQYLKSTVLILSGSYFKLRQYFKIQRNSQSN